MKKLILLLLVSLNAFAGVAPYSLPNDILSLGKPANTATDKVIRFNKNATNNPAIKFNGTTSKIQAAENGTSFYDMLTSNSVDGTTISYSGGQLSVATAGVTTPGMIFAFAGATCPANSLPAAGTSLLRAGTYANLFAAIGTTWGAADGTHFNLPNFSNRMLRGIGNPADGHGGTAVALGAYQEAETRIYTAMVTGTESATHNHGYTTFSPQGQNGGVDGGYASGPYGLGIPSNTFTAPEGTTHYHDLGSGQGGTETRPKVYGVNYCLFY